MRPPIAVTPEVRNGCPSAATICEFIRLYSLPRRRLFHKKRGGHQCPWYTVTSRRGSHPIQSDQRTMVRTHYGTLRLGLLAVALASATAASRSLASPHDFLDVFAQFTQHIRRQTDSDKEAFSKASQCMNWFYRRQRPKPVPPPVQGVAWNSPGRDRQQPDTIIIRM